MCILCLHAYLEPTITALTFHRTIKCLFEEASLFAHSCSPNCSWDIRINDHQSNQIERATQYKWPIIQIEVFAAVPIRKGQMLTIFYSTRFALYGTLQRIVSMEEVAHFLCKCSRCSDKTELGTYMSAIKCSDCEKNYMLPEEPTQIESRWDCLNSLCGGTANVNKIVYRVCKIEEDVEKIRCLNLSPREEVNELQKAFQQYSGEFLHKNHYVLQEISMKILQVLADGEDGILNEGENVELFAKHCQYLLDIAYVLFPAMIRYMGTYNCTYWFYTFLRIFLLLFQIVWRRIFVWPIE